MKLYFKVPPEADGALLRSFLRRCSVSADLSRAVKFRGSGFFADGVPILANRRVEAGQVISFELPPEREGVAPQERHPGGCGLRGRLSPSWWKSRPISRCIPP